MIKTIKNDVRSKNSKFVKTKITHTVAAPERIFGGRQIGDRPIYKWVYPISLPQFAPPSSIFSGGTTVYLLR